MYGYVSGALQHELLNHFDRRIIRSAQKLFRRHCKDHPAGTPEVGLGREASLQDFRQEALTAFILTLRDQQLMTGLAVLVSAVANQKRLSGFDFIFLFSLARFSSTTHLATLDALRTYLRQSKAACFIRVTAMLSILCLLVYATIIEALIVDDEQFLLPVQCTLEHAWSSLSPRTLVFLQLGCVLFFLIYSYAIRIQDVYFGNRHPLFLATSLYWKITQRE